MLKALLLLLFCLSASAQSLQPVASLDIDTGTYAGSYPDSFTPFGDDVYALANIDEQRVLVRMANGSAANASEVRYENQTIPALSLARHGDALFAQVNVGTYVIDTPGAAPHYLPTSASWIGAMPDGQVMMLSFDHLLYRYVRGVGLEEVGRLDDGTAYLSVPIPFDNALYYLAFELGGELELRAIATSGERSKIATLSTSTDTDLSLGSIQTTVVGSELYFAFTHSYAMSQLWRTDGTAAGTHLVFERNYQGYSPAFVSLVGWNQGIAFSTATESNLFLYANGHLETLPIDNTNVPLSRLTPLGQNLLFVAQGGIYRKGVNEPPQRLYNGHLPTQYDRPMVVGNGLAYLITEDGLWTSDGTQAGSGLNPLTGYRAEGDPFPRANELWLSGHRQGFYPELLVLPNSGQIQIHELNTAIYEFSEHHTYPLGTHLLYRHQPTQTLHAVTGTTDSILDTQVHRILTQTASHLYYLKFVNASTQLWRTDGTPAGTTLLLTNGGEGQPSVQYVFPSGDQLYYTNELNYVYTVHRLRADGVSEQLTGYSGYLVYFADGLGGLYVSDQEGPGRTLWHVDAHQTEFQNIISLAGYESEGPTFRMIANRLWMRVAHYQDVTLISSDGTAEGTVTYLDGAQAATLPIEIDGQAGMVVTHDGLEGFALSDGSAPFSADDLTVILSADAAVFPGDGLGQVFGTEAHGENQLWRYDLETGDAVYLAPLTPGLRPFQRVEVGETTLLLLAGQGLVELWQSDGSVEGTEQLASFEGKAVAGLVLDDRFYFSARGPEGDRHQRLYVWDEAEGLQRLAASAALGEPTDLAVVEGHLYFSADDNLDYRIFRLGEGSSLPPIQLTARHLNARGDFVRVSAEQIPGASYHWQVQNAITLGPTNHASLLMRVSPRAQARVTVTVTLANGDVRQGTLDLNSPRPVKLQQGSPMKIHRP